MMRILVADDHAVYRDGLAVHLGDLFQDCQIVQAGDYSATLECASASGPFNLGVIDLMMPGAPWRSALPRVVSALAGAPVVVVSASDRPADIREVLGHGVMGFIPKQSDTRILRNALRLVLDGGTYLPPALLGIEGPGQGEIAEPEPADSGLVRSGNAVPVGLEKPLTQRQAQVLSLLGRGYSNKEIAFDLKLAEATVKLHINALLRALNVHNRTQAVIVAQDLGIL